LPRRSQRDRGGVRGFAETDPSVQPLQWPWRPPIELTGEAEKGRYHDTADHGGIDDDGQRGADAEHLHERQPIGE
jgi:hypothetical protein